MKRILLVEDNATDVELIREAFKESQLPFDLSVSTNGEDALLRLWHSALPDLILLDLNLPKTGGLEILRRLKTDETRKAVPVIILTNSRSDVDVREAYKRHCNAYIQKPLEFEELVATIQALQGFWFGPVTLLQAEDDIGQAPTDPPPSVS